MWDEDARNDFLLQIESETDRLAKLVDDLIDRSTRNHRQLTQQVHTMATPPAALVPGGLDRVRGLLDGRSVEVAVSPDLPLVDVDAPAIERVLANLLHNALKYAPADSHIRLDAQLANGALELRVEDDGPGIGPPIVSRSSIASSALRRQGRPAGLGNGLGLAICLSIVSAHGGRIWADARAGGGTRFTVSLPLPAYGQAIVNSAAASGMRRTLA